MQSQTESACCCSRLKVHGISAGDIACSSLAKKNYLRLSLLVRGSEKEKVASLQT
jgi:hypothetical protein